MSVDSVTEDQTNKVKFASNVSLSLHDGQQDHERMGEKEAVSAADCHPPSLPTNSLVVTAFSSKCVDGELTGGR